MRTSIAVGVILACGIALAVCAISCQNRNPPRDWDTADPSDTRSPEEFRAEGERVVSAICEFRREYGHWPVSLAQLAGPVPDGWEYTFRPDRQTDPYWEVGRGNASPRNSIRFVFYLSNRSGSWNMSWGGHPKSGPGEVAIPDAKTGTQQPHAAVVAKLLADRKADPANTLLYTKVLLQVRLDAGDVKAAIAECRVALEGHPNDVWLTSFLTATLVRDGAATRPEPLPVEKRAEITRLCADYVHAACICHELGLTARAEKMLDTAFAKQMPPLPPEESRAEGVFWYGAVLATRLKDYKRLGQIANKWSAYYSEHMARDTSFWAFRAFADLKQGRVDEARTAMRELNDHRHWARNTDALAKAVESGDTEFEYDPGPFPALGTCVLHIR